MMVSNLSWNRRHSRPVETIIEDVKATPRQAREDRAPEPQRVFFGYRSIGSISFSREAATHRWRAHNAAGHVISTHTYRWQAERAAEALGMVRVGGAE
jgi:hypothetical protein